MVGSPEFGQIGIDFASVTEQFFDDIIFQHGIMTCPFLRVHGRPRDQRLVKLSVTLCPTYRVDMLPERAVKGQCVEL